MTHAQRWHAHRRSAGSGHLDQGRFKSFTVQDDGHLITLCRHVERNALRAGLVPRAEDWRRGGLRRHLAEGPAPGPTLSPWPIERPGGWVGRLNDPPGPAEEEALRRAVRRGQPFGSEGWRAATASRLGLGATLRPRGRPRQAPTNGP